MARVLQFRRGDTATSDAFTGAVAELFVDTEVNELILHDGTTTGGYRLARKGDLPSNLLELGITDGTSGQILTTDGSGNFSFIDNTSEDFQTHTVSDITDGTGFLINDGAGNWSYDNNTYQLELVSGANIKTINSASLLGTGNITVLESETDPVFTAHTVSDIIDGTGFLVNDGVGNWTYDNSDYQLQLISGTNIKTINSQSILGSGNIELAATETDPVFTAHTVSDITDGTGFLTNDGIGNWSYDSNTYQLELVSGTNIKTINGTSLLGSGNIDLSGIETDPVFTAHTVSDITDGTGFLVNDGVGNWTYDNSTYLTSADVTGANDATITISAGDGLGAGGDFTTNQDLAETITLTNTDKGSTQNIFKTFAVSGQTSIVAGSNNDTFNVNAGSNITLTTDAATNTLTITGADPGETITYTAGEGLSLSTNTFSLTNLAAGSATIGAVSYNGTTQAAGKFDGGTTAPVSTTRLNYDGNFYANAFYGDGSNLTGIQGTTYDAGSGLTLAGTTFNHTNNVTAGTVEEGGTTRTLTFGESFNIPSVTYDSQGHISSTTTLVLTMPSNPNTDTDTVTRVRGTDTGTYVSGDITLVEGSNVTITQNTNNITIASTDTNTTYSAGDGLTLTGTQFTLTDVTAGSTSIGAVSYNGTTKTAGKFDGGTTAPSNTTRLNYDGNFYATAFYGDGSNLTNLSAGGATLSNDTTTDTTQYLGMARATTGDWTEAYVSDTKLYFNPSTGTLNSTEFNSLSDANYKENVIQIENATETIKQIDGVEFNWKDNGNKSAGVIAQELEKVLPHLVSTNKDGVKSVNYSGIIGYLVETVKELSAEIEALKK